MLRHKLLNKKSTGILREWILYMLLS